MVAIVSTLLSSVGRSNAPETAGNGGFAVGWPRKPLSEREQRRLLAADVGAGAAVHRDLGRPAVPAAARPT